MKLATTIQHHPSRKHLLPPLLAAVGLSARICTDPEPTGRPSAWRTYSAALRSAQTETHLLILQDDTICCSDFLERTTAAVEAHPEAMLALFVPGGPPIFRQQVLRAAKARQEFADLTPCPWIPLVACIWPVQHIGSFLSWAESRVRPDFRGDDSIVGLWAKNQRIPRLATVPSLVEHPDHEESLVGRRAGHGENKARVAALYVG